MKSSQQSELLFCLKEISSFFCFQPQPARRQLNARQKGGSKDSFCLQNDDKQQANAKTRQHNVNTKELIDFIDEQHSCLSGYL